MENLLTVRVLSCGLSTGHYADFPLLFRGLSAGLFVDNPWLYRLLYQSPE